MAETTPADSTATTTPTGTTTPVKSEDKKGGLMKASLWGGGIGLAAGLSIAYHNKSGVLGYILWGVGGAVIVGGVFAGGNMFMNREKSTPDAGTTKPEPAATK